MNARLRKDAEEIIKESIRAVLPDAAVRKAMREFLPGNGKVILIAVGKAAWQMAAAAVRECSRIDVRDALKNNDSYHALQAVDGLIFTGPTGTNVNDVSIALVEQ